MFVGLLLSSTTMLSASIPYSSSGIFANKNNKKTNDPRPPAIAERQERTSCTQKTKKACGLCTIEQGKWAVTTKFAVAPTWYSDRGDTLLIGQIAPTGLNSKHKLEEFDDMFDLPLMYGGHVGYMFRKQIEFFLDFDYTHAEGDTVHHHFKSTRIKQKFNDYKAFGAYIGTRLYLSFFKERFTPFLGVKVGYMHRWKVKTHDEIFTSSGKFEHSRTFFPSDNTIAGSAGIGFDIYFNRWVAFSFETECLIAGQRRSATIFTPTPGPVVRVGDTGPMISVPISFALKFKF